MPAPDAGAPKPQQALPAVLVTRPAAEAGAWVADLQARGIPAEALPLIEISPAADLGPAHDSWSAMGSYAALMFVSGNAVQYFFAARPASAAGALPPQLRFMAPGPGTARRLAAAGVPVGQIDMPPLEAARFDSQSLWAVVGQRAWAGQRVLIVRGQSGPAPAAEVSEALPTEAATPGRDWLARRWKDAGAAVEFVTVYQRHPPHLDAAALSRIGRGSHDGSVWLFSSSEALAYLPRPAGADWSQARAIATHPRIAQAARDAGWGVVVDSRPALDDIVASIESLL